MSLQEEDSFLCPYCCQKNSIGIDLSAGDHQKLLTDCEVCCSPIVVDVTLDDERVECIDARKENE